MSDDRGVILCRCEDLRDADLDNAIRTFGVASLEELKRHTRATMGPCQGRVCRSWLMGYWDRAIAAGLMPNQRTHPPNSVADLPSNSGTIPGHRPPVRPVRVADIAALSIGEAAPWGDKEAP